MSVGRKVKAIIERANDGTYSVYMDADDMDYMVTGTGQTAEEAIKVFRGGYEDTKKNIMRKREKHLKKSISISSMTWPHSCHISLRRSLWLDYPV